MMDVLETVMLILAHAIHFSNEFICGDQYTAIKML